MKKSIHIPPVAEAVSKLTDIEKLSVYMDYYITQLALKNDFKFIDKTQKDWSFGYGKPDKEVYNIAIYYQCKDLHIMTFSEFISPSNLKVTYCGDDWKERGYAQAYKVDALGIYHWLKKINL